MSIKTRPWLIPFLAWSFAIRVWLLPSWACTALPVLGYNHQISTQKQNEHCLWGILRTKALISVCLGVFLSSCILSELRLSLKARTVSDKHQSKYRSDNMLGTGQKLSDLFKQPQNSLIILSMLQWKTACVTVLLAKNKFENTPYPKQTPVAVRQWAEAWAHCRGTSTEIPASESEGMLKFICFWGINKTRF